MQFGTTNTPADYQGSMNMAIRQADNNFASAYLDVDSKHSDLEVEHDSHVKWIMQRLLEAE
jgi:hypothetical protein